MASTIEPTVLDVETSAGFPEGTTASRCTGCGEVRISVPGDHSDEWKNHFDYCPAEDGQDQDNDW